MPLPERGKIYVPQTMGEIRDDYLADLRGAMLAAGVSNPAVQPGTDNYLRAETLAYMMLGGYANIEIHARNQDEREATGDALDAIRESLGLPIVAATPSAGRIVVSVSGGGTVTIADGQQFVLPNGLIGKVDGVHLAVADRGEVDVITVSTGSATEAAGGTKVRFVSPPPNVSETAYVSTSVPLTGGTDTESDERKRERIQNARRNRPSGGNWAHKVEICLNALASVQAAFVYPALGGPSNERIVVVKDIDPELRDFSRTLSDSAVRRVADAIHSESPSPADIVVSSAVDEAVDVAIQVTIPDAVGAGGNGNGWLDTVVWPDLQGADNGRVRVTAVGATNVISVSAQTSTSPVATQTHIAWWNPVDQRFEVRLVTSASGSAGAWSLTLDKPLVASDNTSVAVNDFISPGAVNSESYGKTFRDVMRKLGPGENTTDAARLPRALRQPRPADAWPSSLTLTQLTQMKAEHAEISDGQFSYRSATAPTVPASTATPPNILKLRRFALYRL